ncbi:MAG: CoA transferase, partial [Acidobacteriota bacterium]
ADSHRPGVLEKWGLDYDELCKVKPDLIMIRSSNQGLTGPAALQPGLGNHINGLGGIVNLVGLPDEEPISPMVAYTDYCVPHFAASVLVGALDCRRKTGKGQLIDLSQFEAGLQLIAPLLLEYSVNGTEAKAEGNACEYAVPHGVFRCKGEDRWCAITVFTEDEWQAMCVVMENPEWTEDSEFSSFPERKKNEEKLNHLIEKWTSRHDPEHVMTVLQAEGVAAGVVQNAEDVFGDPQLEEREFFWNVDHKELGSFAHLGQPSRLSETPARLYRSAPSLGEHTEYICSEILGISEDEFARYLSEGVFGS